MSAMVCRFSLLSHVSTNSCIGLKMHDGLAEEHAAFWRSIQGSAQVSRVSSLADALVMAEQQSTWENGVRTLITGSTHLVGQALALL